MKIKARVTGVHKATSNGDDIAVVEANGWFDADPDDTTIRPGILKFDVRIENANAYYIGRELAVTIEPIG